MYDICILLKFENYMNIESLKQCLNLYIRKSCWILCENWQFLKKKLHVSFCNKLFLKSMYHYFLSINFIKIIQCISIVIHLCSNCIRNIFMVTKFKYIVEIDICMFLLKISHLIMHSFFYKDIKNSMHHHGDSHGPINGCF